MFQHLVEPATAVNMIVFRALGLLKGCVTLCGDFEVRKVLHVVRVAIVLPRDACFYGTAAALLVRAAMSTTPQTGGAPPSPCTASRLLPKMPLRSGYTPRVEKQLDWRDIGNRYSCAGNTSEGLSLTSSNFGA